MGIRITIVPSEATSSNLYRKFIKSLKVRSFDLDPDPDPDFDFDFGDTLNLVPFWTDPLL